MKIFAYILCFILMLFCNFIQALATPAPATPPSIIDVSVPLLDLRQWDSESVQELDGTWALAGEGLPPLVQVPSTWKQLTDKKPPVGQSGVYRLNVFLSKDLLGQRLILDIPDIHPYFRARVNGQLVAQSGTRVSEGYKIASRAHSRVGFEVKQTELNIEIMFEHVGDFSNGLRSAPLLGAEQVMAKRDLYAQITHFALLGGLLVLMGYHSVLYWQRREPELFYFIGICSISFFHYGLYFAHIPELLWQDLPFYISVRVVRLLGIYPFTYVGLAYFHTLFGIPHYARVRPWILGVVCFCIFSLCLPIAWANRVLQFYQIFCLPLLLYCGVRTVLIWKKKQNRIFVYSVVFLTVCLVQAALLDLRLIQGFYWLPLGSLVFLFGQAVFLSQSFYKDFTEARTLKQALELSNQTLEQQVLERTESLRLKTEEVTQLGQFKEKVTRMVAHDLRAPLSAILYFTRKGQLSAAQTALVNQTAQEAQNLVLDLFALKKFENQRFEAQLKPVDISAIVEQVLRQLKHLSVDKQIEITLQTQAVLADQKLLFRVLQNLLTNAFHYTPPDGCIKITMEIKQKKAILSIEDTGPGFPDSVLEGVYVESADNGLGISFCVLALEAQKSQLKLFNTANGARVEVSLNRYFQDLPVLRLSASEISDIVPIIKALLTLPSYAYSDIEHHIDNICDSLSKQNLDFGNALKQAHYEGNTAHYQQLVESLQYACTSGG